MIKEALLITLFTIGTIETARADDLHRAELIRVIDGDTVEVMYKATVRLNDIDCFENKPNGRQKWQAEENNISEEEVITRGKESEQILKDLLKDNEDNLFLQVTGTDKYKRLLGNLYIDKEKKVDVNKYMLNKGRCMAYKPRQYKESTGTRKKTIREIYNIGDYEKSHKEYLEKIEELKKEYKEIQERNEQLIRKLM